MADLDIHNSRLRVEALDARLWKGRWLTALITPWCMNLVLLPAAQGEWTSGSGHERIFYKFPAGDLAFLCGHEAEVNEYHSCALFSNMAEFVDQDSARATAAAALDALFQPAAPSPREETAPPGGAAPPSLSRRAFLGGCRTRQ